MVCYFVALRRCQGYLDVFVWGYLLYYTAILIVNVLNIAIVIVIDFLIELLFLGVFAYFSYAGNGDYGENGNNDSFRQLEHIQ